MPNLTTEESRKLNRESPLFQQLKLGSLLEETTKNANTEVTQVEAESGSSQEIKAWTPERVNQAIQALTSGTGQSIDFSFLSSGSADESNGIFTNWVNLVAAVEAVPISLPKKIHIIFNSTDIAPNIDIASILNMNMTNVELIGLTRGGTRGTLTFLSNSTFVNNTFPTTLRNIKLKFKKDTSNSVSCVYSTLGTHVINMYNATIEKDDTDTNTEEGFVLQLATDDIKLLINMYGNSKILGDAGEGFSAIQIGLGAEVTNPILELNLYDTSELNASAINGDADAIFIKHSSGVVIPNQTNNAFTVFTTTDLSNPTDFTLTTEADQTGLNNVYSDTAAGATALIDAMARVTGPKRLYLKSIIAGNHDIPAITNVDWHEVEIIGIGQGNTLPQLVFADGFAFANDGFPHTLRSMGIVTNGTTANNICIVTKLSNIFKMYSANIENGGSSTGVILTTSTASAKITFKLYEGSTFTNANDIAIVNLGLSTNQLLIELYDGSRIDGNTVKGVVSSLLDIKAKTLDVITFPEDFATSGHLGTFTTRLIGTPMVLTTTQRNALTEKKNGNIIYNSTINKHQVVENNVWRDNTTAADSA